MLKGGDPVELETPGGGGYGDPQERPLELIRRDLALGYVSPAQAAAVFSTKEA